MREKWKYERIMYDIKKKVGAVAIRSPCPLNNEYCYEYVIGERTILEMCKYLDNFSWNFWNNEEKCVYANSLEFVLDSGDFY